MSLLPYRLTLNSAKLCWIPLSWTKLTGYLYFYIFIDMRIIINVAVQTWTLWSATFTTHGLIASSLKGTHGVYTAKEVRIGDNVFIGANSIICSGVRIGSGAIIEHGSIVRRVSWPGVSTSRTLTDSIQDVPSNVVVSMGAAGVKQVYFDES